MSARPFSELSDSGLLWLINRVVFHPRGFALTMHRDGIDGACVGWSLQGDGSEVWSFGEGEDDLFDKVARTLDNARVDEQKVRSPGAAALRDAAQDYREHVHDEHPDPSDRIDHINRVHADRACSWLERRADLMGGLATVADPTPTRLTDVEREAVHRLMRGWRGTDEGLRRSVLDAVERIVAARVAAALAEADQVSEVRKRAWADRYNAGDTDPDSPARAAFAEVQQIIRAAALTQPADTEGA